ncbi:MAG: ribbon-helix-helix domain-containing protein [Thainema sp.]
MAQHDARRAIVGILGVGKVKVKLKMGGKTDLERVVAYIPAERKKELEEWAQTDERSVSWLVAKLIDKTLQERRQQPSTSKSLLHN